MKSWRLLDTGKRPAFENMALDEVLLEARSRGVSQNTIRFLQFSPKAVLVGYNQSVELEIRENFCKDSKIDINRRITGGGAILFDESQIGWEIISDKSFFKDENLTKKFFKNLSNPVINALKKMEINANFRGRNDIEVNKRKISGTGGTELNGAFLFQGTLLVDFDVETMLKALRIPIEKLKYKEIDSVKERVTCLKWELGKIPDEREIKKILKESFEEYFNISLIEKGLNHFEEELFEEKRKKFLSSGWVYRVKVKNTDSRVVSSIYKARGGLIRTTITLNDNLTRIKTVLITGDFFAYPKNAIFNLESELKDIKIDLVLIEETVKSVFKKEKIKIPDIKEEDFIKAIKETLLKVDIAKHGFTLLESNKIFLVNEHFEEVLKKKPAYLLLPYCAKLASCEFRYKNECLICSKCSTSDVYALAKDRGLIPITITSFEHLMKTLKQFKKEGVNAYIGSCCEPFYAKHRKDFEKYEIPAILIDIDNTVCYELGKEQDAYKGKFESQTALNVDLIKKVLDVKV